MASQPDGQDAAAIYFAEVERLCEGDPSLSSLAAGILAGMTLGVAHDSRSFARLLGIEHALVLREVELLSSAGSLAITARDPRTSRTSYARASRSPMAANDRH